MNITGYSKNVGTHGDVNKTNKFNLFYNQFDGMASLHPALSPAHPSSAAASISPITSTSIIIASPSTAGHSSPTFTAEEVSTELKRLHPEEAADPHGLCSRLLKDGMHRSACCAPPLALLHQSSDRKGSSVVENIMSHTGAQSRPARMNNHVALTSHIKKTMEQFCLMRPEVTHAVDPFQFCVPRTHWGGGSSPLFSPKDLLVFRGNGVWYENQHQNQQQN